VFDASRLRPCSTRDVGAGTGEVPAPKTPLRIR
jgi:hypothetical protein